MAKKFDRTQLMASYAALQGANDGWPDDLPMPGADPQMDAALLMYAAESALRHHIVVVEELLLPELWPKAGEFPTIRVRRVSHPDHPVTCVGIDSSAFRAFEPNVKLRCAEVADGGRERFGWEYNAFPLSHTMLPRGQQRLFDTVYYIWMGVDILLSRRFGA